MPPVSCINSKQQERADESFDVCGIRPHNNIYPIDRTRGVGISMKSTEHIGTLGVGTLCHGPKELALTNVRHFDHTIGNELFSVFDNDSFRLETDHGWQKFQKRSIYNKLMSNTKLTDCVAAIISSERKILTNRFCRFEVCLKFRRIHVRVNSFYLWVAREVAADLMYKRLTRFYPSRVYDEQIPHLTPLIDPKIFKILLSRAYRFASTIEYRVEHLRGGQLHVHQQQGSNDGVCGEGGMFRVIMKCRGCIVEGFGTERWHAMIRAAQNLYHQFTGRFYGQILYNIGDHASYKAMKYQQTSVRDFVSRMGL